MFPVSTLPIDLRLVDSTIPNISTTTGSTFFCNWVWVKLFEKKKKEKTLDNQVNNVYNNTTSVGHDHVLK